MQISDNVLEGSSLNDEEDYNTTLNSIQAAEKTIGSNMQAPEVDTKFYQMHGNKYQNLLAENDKIDSSILDQIIGDKPNKELVKTQNVKEAKKVEQKKTLEEKSKHQKAFDAISIHFSDDADAIN